MCKVIAISNTKGGVGKTCLATNIGIGLSRMGKKVLIIDADAQGSATISLGYSEPDQIDISLATILGKVINEEKMKFGEGFLNHPEGITLLPGNIELAGIEVSMINIMSRELVLKRYIKQVEDEFDVIIIDCSPSLGMITINALSCADYLIIPCSTGYVPAKALEQLLKTVGKVKRQINPSLKIAGIAITMVDRRTNYAKEIAELIEETYGDKIGIFKNQIPMAVRVAECAVEGCSIYHYDPKGKATKCFEGLTREVFDIVC